MNVADFALPLRRSPEHGPALTAFRHLPARPASSADCPASIRPELRRALAALQLLCDPKDLAVQPEVCSPFTGEPTVYRRERAPGGVGFSERLFALRHALLANALEAARAERGRVHLTVTAWAAPAPVRWPPARCRPYRPFVAGPQGGEVR